MTHGVYRRLVAVALEINSRSVVELLRSQERCPMTRDLQNIFKLLDEAVEILCEVEDLLKTEVPS